MGNLTYKDSGVNIDQANLFVNEIGPLIKSTHSSRVLGGLGSFGGLFDLKGMDYKHPVLVSSTDGVGTKLKLAFSLERHHTVGIDLVAMNVNDILACGAKPLFFLDYLAVAKLEVNQAAKVIEGIVQGCQMSECALIGGETAELPGFYQPGEYELAGFCVGIVDREKILDGTKVKDGQVIIGLESSGLHSNGFSLARKICFDVKGLNPSDCPAELEGTSIGQELLTPTSIYVKPVLQILKQYPISAIAHITGGGFYDNIERVLPTSFAAMIDSAAWSRKQIFHLLQEWGNVDEKEMFRTFNMGIGMVMIADKSDANQIIDTLEKDHNLAASKIGFITKRHEKLISVEVI